MRPSWIALHSQFGKENHDSFDFPDVDTDMKKRHVHYDYYGEIITKTVKKEKIESPLVVRQWPVNEIGAATRGWNGSQGGQRAINFAFAGDGRVECPPDSLLEEMARYIYEAMETYGISIDQVKLHRDMPGASTTCPGDVFATKAWPKLRAMIQKKFGITTV